MALVNPHWFKEKQKLRKWVLCEFGDGTHAPCAFCGKPLTIDSMTLDHYPIPACMGGEYVRGNVRPACKGCNNDDGKRIEKLAAVTSKQQFRRELGIDKRRAAIGEFTYSIGDAVSGRGLELLDRLLEARHASLRTLIVNNPDSHTPGIE